MRFNGIDVNTIHPVIRLSKEIPPGVEYEIATVEGRNGEIYAGRTKRRKEYRVIVNVAGRTHAQMMTARAALAAWAGGGQGMLEPTHWAGMAYDAVLESMEAPEKRFTTIELVFVLPAGDAYEVRISTARGNGSVMMRIGGTESAEPVIQQTIAANRTGVTWRLNGGALMTYTGQLAAGDVLTMDLKTKALLVNGQHRESEMDYINTTFEAPFPPGKNTVTSNDAGAMEARWNNVWL